MFLVKKSYWFLSNIFRPFRSCNAVRVFLYDMGLVDRKIFGQDLIALDPTSAEDYYNTLHETVDKQSTKRTECVSVFYVKKGQQNSFEILRNTVSYYFKIKLFNF